MAHQLADVLFLPAQCAVRFHLFRFQNRFAKIVIDRQAVEIGLSQRNQFLAQFLQGDILAFSCAFAGL